MNVKLVRFSFGQEVIGELIEEFDTYIIIKDALAAVPTGQGQLGFVPWAPIISKTDNQLTIAKSFVVYIATPDDDVIKYHKSVFGRVITTEKSLIL